MAKREQQSLSAANGWMQLSTCSTVRDLFQSADGIVTESNTCTGSVYPAQDVEGI